MLKNLYLKLRTLAASEKANPALAIVSFAEASFFPIPPDVMILPMAATNPKNWWKTAAIATVASVLGAVFGYFIGLFLMDTVGKPLMEFYGYAEKMVHFNEQFQKYGALVILIKGLTPIPFKLVTILSGMTKFNFLIFVLSCAITRGARFFGVAWLAQKFGPSIEPFIEKQLYWVTGAVAFFIVFGFWLITVI